MSKKTKKDTRYHTHTDTTAVRHLGGQLSPLSLPGKITLAFLRHMDTSAKADRQGQAGLKYMRCRDMSWSRAYVEDLET